uniref:WD and tetratricopeptide repeat protein n=1 Tax=Riptortus pedestris TaxID=329032 RepID=R4WSS7_RIPPE|nr:WD and tetratricopeptide repeat protein [Riptortus pedestris]
MPQKQSVVKLISKREVDAQVCRSLQKRLHVTENLINRLGLEKELEGHSGCVNCLEWDSKGRYLASASDDFQVILWDPFLYKNLQVIPTGHHGNIFSVKFMPESNDNTIITGAGDYELRVHNLICKETTRVCHCHGGRVKRLATSTDSPNLFWSAAEDGIIRQFDLRVQHSCLKNEKNVLVDLRTYLCDSFVEAKCICVNPLRPELLAVGANDPYIRIYDRRMIKPVKGPPVSSSFAEDNLPPGCVQYFVPGHVPCRRRLTERELRQYSATYVTFGPNGTDLLVNLGSEQIYLFDITTKSKSLLVKLTNDNKEVSEPLKAYCNGLRGDNGFLSSKHKPQLPEHINALKLAGNSLFEKEQYSRSIRVYNEAIEQYPNSSVFYSNRAAAYMKRDWCGDIYAGLRDCITSLSYDPNNVKAFFRLTRCLYELSWYEEALASLTNFKERFPSHAKSVACAALEKDIKNKLKNEDVCDKDSSESREEFHDINGKEILWREEARDYILRFYGHCNTTTDIKEANFFGCDGQYIVAGSDDGSIFIWDRKTTNSIRVLRGDSSIVNCLQPHPVYCLLATSGIEHVVRLWSPRPEDGHENDQEIKEKDEVASSNQHRMRADPFDMVLMNITSNSANSTTYNCRTS